MQLRTDVAKDGLDWHFTLCRLWQTWPNKELKKDLPPESDLDLRSDHDWIETSMSKPAFSIYTALALTFWQIGDSHGQEPRAKTLNISNVLRGIWFHRHTSAANSAWVGHMWQYSFVSLQNTTKLQPTNVQVCFASPTLYLSIFPLLRPHNAEIEYLNIVAWMSETLVGIGEHSRWWIFDGACTKIEGKPGKQSRIFKTIPEERIIHWFCRIWLDAIRLTAKTVQYMWLRVFAIAWLLAVKVPPLSLVEPWYASTSRKNNKLKLTAWRLKGKWNQRFKKALPNDRVD